jgi:hypothetical protein
MSFPAFGLQLAAGLAEKDEMEAKGQELKAVTPQLLPPSRV